MADLEFVERHVLRQLISKGHDSCVPHAKMQKEVLESLVEKGLMVRVRDYYQLTDVGKTLQLKDLR